MTLGARVGVGVLTLALFAISSAVALLPVRTADTGMALAFLSGSGAKRIVRDVVPGGAASRAGIRDGDIVDLARMGANDRLSLYWAPAPNDVPVPIQRDGSQFVAHVHLRAPLEPLPFWAIAVTLVTNTAYVWLVFLILRRGAERLEQRILLGWILAQMANNDYYLIYAPTGVLAYVFAAMTPLTGAFLYYFVARFVLVVPNRKSPLQPLLGRLIPYVLFLYLVGFVLAAVANFFPQFDYGNGVRSQPMTLLWYGDLLALTLIVTIIIDGLIHTSSKERVQLQWVASTVLLMAVVEIVRAIFYLVSGSAPDVIDQIAFPIESVTVLGAAYAVLRHHLIDLEVVISRAAIFAAVSLILLAAFVVAEWLVANLAEKIIGEVSFASVERYAGLAAALIAGLLARPVHNIVERSLNRFIFRRQHADEQALRRFAREAERATSGDALLSSAFEVLRAHVTGSFVAIMVRDGSGYRTSRSSRPVSESFFDENTALVRQLRDLGEPFEVQEAGSEFQGSMIFPMTMLGYLIAFIICGPKVDRTRYSERDVETLAGFAHRVGTAYAWLQGGRGSLESSR